MIRQPLLIERIIAAVGFDEKQVCSKPTPSTGILHKDEDDQGRKDQWNYRSVVGMLNYLVNATRPDIMMAVHQCTRFCEDPKLSKEKAVKRVVKHLLGTRHIGIQAMINTDLGLTAYADSDFANGWDKLTPDDASSLFSRSGHVIYYMGMPIV